MMIIALIYLDRLVLRSSVNDFELSPSTVKLSLLTALVLAAKFYDDRFEKNTIFSAVAGLSRKKLRKLTSFFLN